MFSYPVTIRLRDTDAAGVLFFARQFDLVHDAYEAFMEARGFSLAYLLREAPYFLAIVRAESDYKAPLRIGDRLTVQVGVETMGDRSYSMAYTLERDGEVVGTARTVHVAIDAASRQAVSIPDPLRAALEA